KTGSVEIRICRSTLWNPVGKCNSRFPWSSKQFHRLRSRFALHEQFAKASVIPRRTVDRQI
ncbi:MAG TPA: hypothetical protein V6D16_13640, partial [Candidatus Obscuribacterales bacterium]